MTESMKLHERVTLVEQKLKDTHALAAGADKEVSTFREMLKGHTQVLYALRQTQIEQGGMLAAHSGTLAEHSSLLAEHSSLLAEHSRILAILKTGQDKITELLTTHLVGRTGGAS